MNIQLMNQIAFLVATILLLAATEGKLFQAVSLFRHGARYHVQSDNLTNQSGGELTPVGMRQHETLGTMLRRDYIDRLGFLQKNYAVGSIQIISSDINRAIQSALCQLYGLYPLGSGQKISNISKDLLIPPYSVQFDNDENQYILPHGYLPFAININSSVVMTDRDNWDNIAQDNINRQLPIYDEMWMTYAPFMRRIGQNFGIDPAAMDMSKFSLLYDNLTVERYLGMPMPSNLTEDDYLNMRHLHYWLNNFQISFNLSKAINTGKLNRILEDFDGRIANSQQLLKWTFLSAHEADITGMLLDLNISSASCVEELYRDGKTDALNCDPSQEYASNIIFELHSDNEKDFYVKIRHNGRYVYLCDQKETSCPYLLWKQRVKQNIIMDADAINKLCFAKSEVETPDRQKAVL